MATASAATLDTVPGRSIQILPCTPKAMAACWRTAQPLTRFVGMKPHDVREVDVRLAWENEHLIVRNRGHHPDESLEIVVHPGETNNLNQAQLFIAQPGVSSHKLQTPVKIGQVRTIRILLRDKKTGKTRTWAPTGHGDRSRPATVWFSQTPAVETNLTVESIDEHTWTIQSDVQQPVNITHRRPHRPVGGKGIPKAWSIQATPGTPFSSPPFTGWYDLSIRSGVGADFRLTTASLYWEPPVGERLVELGIHPAPKETKLLDDGPFVLNADTTLCINDPKLAWSETWFKREMNRLTKVELNSGCTDANIHFTLEPNADIPKQGFRIETKRDHIQLVASEPQGALYGAMALSEWFGLDGQAPAAMVRDWPTVATRTLFHHAVPNAGAMVRVEDTKAFIERVVARGRYTMLVLSLTGAMQLPSRPELVRKDAWTHEELQSVLDLAEKYGIEVIPAINSPAHSRWLIRAYPELSAEGAGNLLCMQHPKTRPLLRDLYTDVYAAFRKPRFIHIGHDEIRFRTQWKHEEQRCERCDGTPRWRLLEEDLLWNHQTLADIGTRPMLWSDMLVREWNGSWDGMYRVVNRIPESIRPDFMVMSWGRVGDTLGTLVPMGYAVMRGNTGYGDWKRTGLEPVAAGVAGEALALFVPTPWNSMDGSKEGVQLYHHWSNALLAGATAWEPRIETTTIETSLLALLDHPAYIPGYNAWSADSTVKKFLGDASIKTPWKLADQLSVLGVPYSSLASFTVSKGTSERFLFGRKLDGISLLQAVSFSQSAGLRLAHAHRKRPHQEGYPVAGIEVVYKDGGRLEVPVRLGLDTHQADVPIRGSILWQGAGSLRVASESGGPATQRLYRLDWHNPHPDRIVQAIRFYGKDPAVEWTVVGLASINPKATRTDPDPQESPTR